LSGVARLPRETRAGTLRSVTKGTRKKDEALAKYYAYRIALYLREHEGSSWAKLAKLMGLAKPEMTALKDGKTGTLQKLAQIARVLHPESETEFKKLAHAWAEQNLSWKPGDPLPERITHTGHPLETSPKGGTSVYSEDLRDAAVAIVGLAKITPTQARDLAEKVWAKWPEARGKDWKFWLDQMYVLIDDVKRGSGERPSNRHKLP